jgi:hypothetical protein
MSTGDTSIPASEGSGLTGGMRRFRFIRQVGRIARSVFLTLLICWAGMAIYYSNLPGPLRPVVAVAFVAVSIYLLLWVKSRTKGRLAFSAMFAVVVGCWMTIPPSNDRDWQPDLAVLPWADVVGSRVTVHNIRNCDYRSETDFTVRHYDRTFDLDKLLGDDLFIIHWGSPHIAHTMLSFAFEGDQYLCFSVETRKEKGEDYSTIKGFFKQYELIYVVADERDLVRLRTNFRDEEVRVYRLQTEPAAVRGVFLEFLKSMNSLHDKPQWYNALTDNCTTNLSDHSPKCRGIKGFDWRILLNGHLDELLYERGTVDRSLPLAELNFRSFINARAQAAGDGEDFSRRIREGLPGMSRK